MNKGRQNEKNKIMPTSKIFPSFICHDSFIQFYDLQTLKNHVFLSKHLNKNKFQNNW